MIIELRAGCALQDRAAVVRAIENEGLRVQVSQQGESSLIGVVGTVPEDLVRRLSDMGGVAAVRPDAAPYPLASLERKPERSRVRVDDVVFAEGNFVVIAGPCSVESEEQMQLASRAVRDYGASMLRGGAFKPRSSPYSFQGLGSEGLRLLADARAETGLPFVTEVVAPEDVDEVSRVADMLQIGARNMQNFRLLSAVGEQPRPVLLKRSMMSTIEELLLAAEYVMAAGNPRVILCERGLRGFDTATRATLDISAVPVLREKTHLPVIVDPSHAAGRREIVPALARAAVAAGADGIIVETHPDPGKALSDGRQSLTFEQFAEMMDDIRRLAAAMSLEVPERQSV